MNTYSELNILAKLVHLSQSKKFSTEIQSSEIKYVYSALYC